MALQLCVLVQACTIWLQNEIAMQVITPHQPKLAGISFFFPAHNEQDNIRPMVTGALGFLPHITPNFEIIVVNDGSSDQTSNVAHALAKQHTQVRVVDHEANLGYGAALKSGIRAARYPWIFFTDGDRQFDITELPLLLDALQEENSAVIGYRIKRSDPGHRTINAFLYKSLIRLLFGLNVRDIDCAFKLLKTDNVQTIPLKSDGALISAEMLIRLKRRGVKILEVGVHHYPRLTGRQSGANIKVVLRMFCELFKLAGDLKSEVQVSNPIGPTTPRVM